MEDVETFITPLLSQDKIVGLTEFRPLILAESLKDQLKQANITTLNDAGSKLVSIYGEKLISFLNVYLGTLGKKLDYRDGHIEQADNTAVQLLNELLKEALFAHLGLPR
ncbi:hypothetical protein FKV88_09935, partial [Weissella paramesenteroides]